MFICGLTALQLLWFSLAARFPADSFDLASHGHSIWQCSTLASSVLGHNLVHISHPHFAAYVIIFLLHPCTAKFMDLFTACTRSSIRGG